MAAAPTGYGQPDGDGRALALLAGDGDGSPCLFNHGLADGQAQAGAAGGAGAGRIAAVEALKYMGQRLGRYAFALVLDDQFDGLAP